MAPERADNDTAIEQLVLLVECKKEVLKIAHDILSGHLGKDKTARHILTGLHRIVMLQSTAKAVQHVKNLQRTM